MTGWERPSGGSWESSIKITAWWDHETQNGCNTVDYGLTANVAKSPTMTCQPGALLSGIYDESKALKFTGVGDSYRVRLRRRILCPECGVDITAWSMTEH